MKFKRLERKVNIDPYRIQIDNKRFYGKNQKTKGLKNNIEKVVPSINTLLSFVSENKKEVENGVDIWLRNKYGIYENSDILIYVQKKFWTTRGDIIHAVLENSIKNGELQKYWIGDDNFREIYRIMSDLAEKQHIPEELSVQEIVKTEDIFFNNFSNGFEKLKKIVWCLTEEMLWCEFAAGTVDACYFNEDKTLSVFDLKTTSKHRGYSNKFHNEKLIEYILQMLAYSRMIEYIYKEKVTKLHLFSVNPDPDPNKYVEEVIVDVDSEIKNKKYKGLCYNDLLDLKIDTFNKTFTF